MSRDPLLRIPAIEEGREDRPDRRFDPVERTGVERCVQLNSAAATDRGEGARKDC